MIICLPVTNFQRLYIHVHKFMFGHKCFMYHIQSMCTNLNSNTCCNINIYIHICDDIYHTCMDHIYIALIHHKKTTKEKKTLFDLENHQLPNPPEKLIAPLEDDLTSRLPILGGWLPTCLPCETSRSTLRLTSLQSKMPIHLCFGFF